MMISLTFIVGFLSFLLLPLACLSIIFFLQSQQQQQQWQQPQQRRQENTSTAANNRHILHSYLTHSHLSSIWKLLLHHAIFPNCPDPTQVVDGESVAGVRLYEGCGGVGGEAAECRVCLCKIEQGEEVRELRCNHLFHKPCLDAWLSTGHSTCPLCRRGVLPPATVDGGTEVLFFPFCDFSGRERDEQRDNWWLR